ncbi:hypothetical protein CHUAL_005986 [Chamberlinius hualienensis]
MEEIRVKSRITHHELRKTTRSKQINSKRLHLTEESEEIDHKYDKLQVSHLAVDLKKSKDETTLKKLKSAFAQGEDLAEEFVRCDGALQSLIRLLIGRQLTLQLESSACFINLFASGNHKITYKAAKLSVPYFGLYLQSSEVNLQELSAWALGNVAADCSICCNLLKSQRFTQSIINLLQKSTSSNVTFSALYALKCYMSHCEPEEWNEILSLDYKRLPILLCEFDEYLMQSGCIELALKHLKEIINKSEKSGEVCLDKSQCQIVTFLIRVIAGVSSNREIALKIIGSIDLPVFSLLLKSNYLHIHKETLWMFNNLSCHEITGPSPWLNQELLRSIVERLLGPEQLVQQVLIFFNHLLHHNRWPPSFQPFSTFILEDTLIRLLSSNSDVIIKLILNLLNHVNDEGDKISQLYGENFQLALKNLQDEEGKFAYFVSNLLVKH